MNWKPGDMAIIVESMTAKSVGQECEIIGPSHLSGWLYVDCPYLGQAPTQPYWSAMPEWLRPIYDGNETTSWEDCIWKPKELIHV